MKDLKDICLVIQARMNSQRVPGKMLKSFAGTCLFDIALQKAEQCIIPNENVFASVYEPELKKVAEKYDVQIFDRSEKSANSEGTPMTEIYEWWDKLPGKYVVLINACCPMLTVETINAFVKTYQCTKNNGAFGVIEKKNYFWTGGWQKEITAPWSATLHEGVDSLIPLTEAVMNTKTAPVTLEAAHVLYAGLLEDIGRDVWMGNLGTGEGMTFISVPEEECLDIDYPWQFEAWEKVYVAKYGVQCPDRILDKVLGIDDREHVAELGVE
jgi:hypothetical protein